MMHAAWFRLAVRLVGVVFFVMGIPLLLGIAGGLLGMFRYGAPENFGWYEFVLWAIPQMSYSVMGAYLLFFGGRLIRACLRDVFGRCDRCGDVLGPAGTSCPNCGLAVPHAAAPASPLSGATSSPSS